MDADPDLEFEFYLAAKLGMTRARLRDEMTSKEFGEWKVYFGRIEQRRQLASGGV